MLGGVIWRNEYVWNFEGELGMCKMYESISMIECEIRWLSHEREFVEYESMKIEE